MVSSCAITGPINNRDAKCEGNYNKIATNVKPAATDKSATCLMATQLLEDVFVRERRAYEQLRNSTHEMQECQRLQGGSNPPQASGKEESPH
jgi:hypothetical protein